MRKLILLIAAVFVVVLPVVAVVYYLRRYEIALESLDTDPESGANLGEQLPVN